MPSFLLVGFVDDWIQSISDYHSIRLTSGIKSPISFLVEFQTPQLCLVESSFPLVSLQRGMFQILLRTWQLLEFQLLPIYPLQTLSFEIRILLLSLRINPAIHIHTLLLWLCYFNLYDFPKEFFLIQFLCCHFCILWHNTTHHIQQLTEQFHITKSSRDSILILLIKYQNQQYIDNNRSTNRTKLIKWTFELLSNQIIQWIQIYSGCNISRQILDENGTFFLLRRC